MNSNQHMLSHVQSAVPRPGHNAPYASSPHPAQQSPYYPPYQYQYPMHYQQRPPQQWTPYPGPMPVGRGYQPYPPPMTHYPMSQHLPQMRPSPQRPPLSSPIHAAQTLYSPSSSSTSLHVPSSASLSTSNSYLAPPTPPPPPSVLPASQRTPFYPPLPWQSFEGAFPPRISRRRRKTPAPQSSSVPVELPSRRGSAANEESGAETVTPDVEAPPSAEESQHQPLSLETPFTSHPPSEDLSTQPTTPSSTAPPQQSTPKINSIGRPNAALAPIVPAIPNICLASRPSQRASVGVALDCVNAAGPSNADHLAIAVQTAAEVTQMAIEDSATASGTAQSPPVRIAPKSWADLVRSVGQAAASGTPQAAQATSGPMPQVNDSSPAKSGSLADALSAYNVKERNENAKTAFLEPRGLVNTGNMCYMNSILQILVFCVPFYNFLETVSKQAIHSFKSDTPLMDAMIMFMREFPVIDAAVTVEQLRMRLKDSELEQYGDAFIPEFVYEVIRRLPRFSSMRRGHQQDAEEFLGFILEEMHDECSRTMRSANTKSCSGVSTPTNSITSPISDSIDAQDGGWLEVGPKQKAATTRSSGAITTESPVTKIFGGKLRSELRVPGMKNSVTLEPYQPLQLDIGAPHVSNIIDALKGLTKPETLHGDFNSPRGPGSTATKQVTIETLPQVLILHLKRFQYDSSGGTQKIWKKVGYPLDLEIPKEVFPQHKRGGMLAHAGLPKYRLIGVIYHHGKNANGGHYTVDVRRQEGREWIRLDDTVIRRIRSEDVAEGGSEEDPKVLAAALEQNKKDQSQSSNVYEQFAAEEEEQKHSEKGWSQVNGVNSTQAPAGKKWSGIANGNITPTHSSGKMTPVGRSSIKDNKVAYILFYQRVSG